MRTTITGADVLDMLDKVATDMEGRKDELCALDAAIGDGDQGVTMAIGFRAIRKGLLALRDQDIGTIVTKSGLTFNGAAASTIGALFATACLRAGREVKGRQEVGLAEVAQMLEAALLGIQERGKAQLGDKTVLDALAPAVEAARAAARAGAPLMDGLRQAVAAAEAGLKSTIPMKSKIGRAAWIADRTVGHQDPGATSFYLMFKAAVDHLAGRPDHEGATEENR
ncbi:MAG TPA: dihydroxyacetone kinase subunit DhaL [Candidatus Methylomirabilis sp.]|nr:dihydroxyacetone kinase subunit DhaL [Candidatus Methylomirabilis sp.]